MVTSEYARNVLPLLNNEGILSSILNSILSRDDEPVTDEALHSILSIKFMYDLCNQKLHITSGLRDLYLRLMFTSNSGEGTCAAHENSAAVRETQGSTKDAHGESHKPASGSKESHAGLEGSIQVEGTILRDLATNHDNYIAANPVAANQQRLPNVGDHSKSSFALDGEYSDSHPRTGDSHPRTGDSLPRTGDSHPRTGDSHPRTGDSHPRTGDSLPRTGDSRPASDRQRDRGGQEKNGDSEEGEQAAASIGEERGQQVIRVYERDYNIRLGGFPPGMTFLLSEMWHQQQCGMGVADDLLPLVCRDVCTLTELPPRRFWYSFICILQQAYQNSLRHRSSYAPSTSTSTMPTTADSSLDQAGSQPPSRSELCSSAIQDLEPALEDTATTAPTAETNPTTDLQAALTYRKQLSSDDSNYPIIQDYSTLQNKLLSPDELTCTWECGLARLVAQAIERLVNLLQAFIDNNPNKVNSEHMQRSMFYLGICVGIVCGVGEYSRIPEQRRLVVLPAGGACGLLTNECREMTKFRSSCWATVLLYKTALLRAEQASGVRLALLLDD